MIARICSMRGRGGVSGEKDSWHNVLEIGPAEYTNTITSVQKDNYVLEINDESQGDSKGR